jgi:hypothetical protein
MVNTEKYEELKTLLIDNITLFNSESLKVIQDNTLSEAFKDKMDYTRNELNKVQSLLIKI